MLGGRCNRTATGLQTCPQHTKAGDYRTRVSLNSQRTVRDSKDPAAATGAGTLTRKLASWKTDIEHSDGCGGDDVPNSAPRTRNSDMSTQKASGWLTDRTDPGPYGVVASSATEPAFLCPTQLGQTNGGQRSPTRRQGTRGHKKLEIRKLAR
jgi:hypothetical protein